MSETDQVSIFIASLKNLSATLLSEPYDAALTDKYLAIAKIEEYPILGDDLTPAEKLTIGQTINYMMLLTEHNQKRYADVRIWLGKVMMKMLSQVRD